MASVSVARPTPSPAPMSRRVPLGNLQHALNSPFNNRTSATNVHGKRQRSADLVRELAFAQPAPKKQAVDAIPQTPVRPKPQVTEKRAPLRKAVRIKTIPEPQESQRHREDASLKGNTAGGMNPQMEAEIRMWQKHYRKAFPTYVFYFESIPDDVAARMYKQVKSLGSKIERFFSTAVTHVVTTRPIPTDPKAAQQQTKSQNASSSKTINPLVLQKTGDSASQLLAYNKAGQQRKINGKVVADLGMRGAVEGIRDNRGTGRGSSDILVKAREYGMKIWSLDKLQRMMDAMFETPVRGREDYRGASTAQNQNVAAISDLSKLLMKERIHGPVDRDPTALTRDMVYFKGPFLLVRDLTETHRPIMVREYPKVQNKEDGDWPQFRSVGSGKCPFVEERGHDHRRRAEKEEVRAEAHREVRTVTKTTATTTMQPPNKKEIKVETQVTQAALSQITTNVAGRKLEPPFQLKRANAPANEIAFTGNIQLQENKSAQALSRRVHEPYASGMQPSNITSAIRSQMVSSHADRLGGTKAAMSKDMYDLKRKVAATITNEKPAKTLSHSARILNLAAIVDGTEADSRAASTAERNMKAHAERTDERRETRRSAVAATAKTVPTVEPCDPKPGYCENCREKFDDFDTHVVSKRHRKFAAAENHWAELDQLLQALERKPKQNW